MQNLANLLAGIPPIAWQTAAAVVAFVVAIFALRGLRTLTRAANQFFRHHIAPRPAEDVLTVIAAAIATGVSAQGMWQFIDRTLHLHPALQAAGFAFIEVAVITSAVRAKRSMKERFSAGVDGIAVWALTGLSAVLSAMEAASLPEAVFRLAAPLVAAWLWERGMAIERHRATGRKRINWRLTPERVLVRAGLAEAQDRTADEVDAHRRLTRIAFAAKRARRLERARAAAWRQHRALRALDRAVEKAVEHAGLADDPERQLAMLTRIRAMFSAEELRHVAAVAPWAALEHPAATATQAATTPDTDTGDATAATAMLRHWNHAITHEGYLPSGPELARAGDCGDSYGRRMRSEWSAKLDPQLREQLEEEAKRRKRGTRLHPRKSITPPTPTTPEPLIAHVNGHHHTDGAA